jgi:hypothetical protein
MRNDMNLFRVRRIKLYGTVGKNIVARIPNDDSARDPKDFSGFTAFGKIIDEDDTTILDLTPTIDSAAAIYDIDKLVPGGTTAGWYRWIGGTIDSAGGEEVLYEGSVYLRAY